MQSRWMSFLETVTNIVVGYGLAVLTQIIVFPLFGLEAALVDHVRNRVDHYLSTEVVDAVLDGFEQFERGLRA